MKLTSMKLKNRIAVVISALTSLFIVRWLWIYLTSGYTWYGSLNPSCLLYNIEVSTEMNSSEYKKFNILKQGPMMYLTDYKNPCWMVNMNPLPNYADNPYSTIMEAMPGQNSTSPYKVFQHLTQMHKDRFGNGDQYRLRCLPLVYIIGGPSGDTSEVYKDLTSHADISTGLLHQPVWWNRKRLIRFTGYGTPIYSFSHYADLYDLASHSISQSFNSSGYHHKIIVDGSGSYLWDYDGWEMYPGNRRLLEPRYTMAESLKAMVPHAKIIAVLSNPVDRLYSEYQHNCNEANPEEFDRLLQDVLANMTGCLRHKRLRSCVYDGSLNLKEFHPVNGSIFLRASMYYSFIVDWLKVFSKDQVIVIHAENYEKQRNLYFDRIMNFLNITNFSQGSFQFISNRKHKQLSKSTNSQSQMLQRTRLKLNEFFKPLNKLLADRLEDASFLWEAS